MTTPLLALEGVSRSFGAHRAVDGVSLRIFAGEVYGLLGPNGSGKSTTLAMISGLLPPEAGTISFDPGSNSRIGLVPQEISLYPALSPAENLRFFCRLYGLGRRETASRVSELLEEIGLTSRASSPVETLSGGMKRKVNIAAALVHRPDLVVLDEPTTGVDIEARFAIWELIRRLRGRGVTVLLTTHALEEAEELCARIGFLHDGRLVAEGTLPELRERIAAVAIASVRSPEPGAVESRAETMGFETRRHGDLVEVWLSRALALDEVADRFRGVPMASLALEPVRLSHVYREVIGAVAAA
jgi:ABC-2 type transport system ATP-binding protein